MLHRDVVLCVGQAALTVSCLCFLWLGRWGSLTRKVSSLPTLRGGPHAVAAPVTCSDLLGAHAERVPNYSSYLLRIPWSAADSGLSIHPRDSEDRAAAGSSAVVSECAVTGAHFVFKRTGITATSHSAASRAARPIPKGVTGNGPVPRTTSWVLAYHPAESCVKTVSSTLSAGMCNIATSSSSSFGEW